MIISLEFIYYIAGIFLTLITVLTLKDKKNPKRVTTALFWGLYALTFLFGKVIPPMYMGIMVILIAVTAGFGGVGLGSYSESTETERKASAKKLGNLLFLPALLIPIVTIIGALWLKDVKIGGLLLLDKSNVTIVSLGIACLIALVVSLLITKQKAMQSIKESRRLIDTIGWASILPQMLAALGGLFTVAGVGTAVTKLVSGAIPVDNKFLVVVAYVLAMALFTMVMGNAFAAFPVITGGIGLPLVVQMHGGNPAVLAAIGMFSGYCGTLMTPMAANYNIVPAALLDLPDKNGVIKAQVPTALMLLTVNIFLMYFLVY
ncbi:DUF979 domain-containing protein [Clostridium magnum]|uniref:Permease n=1 Tax=Clostridium magnum DSM 2767 TaxID=1121326 RepID=A0A162SMV1_9CLOT|nr:DUF979 domain-containing protein [Clostridium magnum]KZL91633.1 hypothetical protein CLMAG_33920 [Clostridium magnum DSM 2767]SHH50319.1 Uncharacterized membrane protein [Clostridium magnum DSM 2767]